MKAIVLTHDRMRAVTEHMLFHYARLWPDHPFRFRIPYQTLSGPADPLREYVAAPAPIKQTVLTLLRDLDDEQWVYWCIDDKYPVAFDLRRVRQLTGWVLGDIPEAISGLVFCRCCKLLQDEYLTGAAITDPWGGVLLERSGYEQIWMPQFLRVKVIRHLFEAFPDEIPYAKVMDDLKQQVDKPASHRLYVVRDNAAMFGESTRRGVLTQVCHDSFVRYRLALPAWHREVDPKGLIRGELPGWQGP